MRARSWISLAFVLLAGTVNAVEPPPALQAKSAILIDEKSGKVLFAKDPDARRFPASTTKIMTALLLLEKCRPDELITAPADVETVPPSSLHLKPGEKITAHDMLYALVIRSANDAAYAVAKHIGGTVEGFSKLMNERAKTIGCTKTNFHNPNGLNDPVHTTSARDLVLMAREAMKNPDFREAANTRKCIISRSINQDDLWLVSKNKILKYDPTADGIKTGYTVPAGHCYVGSATRNGYRFISVILASTKDWPADHKALMGWAFKNFTRTCIEQPSQVMHDLPIGTNPQDTVKAELREPVYYAHPKNELPNLNVELRPKPGVALPIARLMEVGTAVFSDGRGWKFETPLFAAEDSQAHSSIHLSSVASPGPAAVLIACVLGGGALLMRRKARMMF